MAEPSKTPAPPEKDAPDPHDDREIEVQGILRIAAIVAAVTIAAAGAMWFFQGALRSEERSTYTEPPPIARTRPLAPTEPRLQPRPPEGLAELRAKEDGILRSYRWIDPKASVVGIPIDRAIDLLLEHPPASRPASEVPADPTSSRPTQSSLGHAAGGEP